MVQEDPSNYLAIEESRERTRAKRIPGGKDSEGVVSTQGPDGSALRRKQCVCREGSAGEGWAVGLGPKGLVDYLGC